MPKVSRQSTVKNYRLTIAYDGAAYAGWQLQPHGMTVQEVVEKALAVLCGGPVRVHGSGRTDAGVHAQGQVASCELATRHTPETLRRALNANLPDDVRVTGVKRVRANFHARFSAKGKEYRYQIDCGQEADPFLRTQAWHHPRRLDISAMQRAAKLIVGSHDFRPLSANPMREIDTPVRDVTKLSITRKGPILTIAVRADGFLYKMVRSIVGALVKIGESRMTVDELEKIMKSGKRTALVETAPAHGLFLWKVFY